MVNDMTPCNTMLNVIDCSRGNAKFYGNRICRHSAKKLFLDFSYLLRGQFTRLASFQSLIVHIFGMRTNEQMIGIYASCVIARV